MLTNSIAARLLLVGLFCIVLLPAITQSQDDQRQQALDAKLQQWLKQYPDADTNSDGKLTIEEARAYHDRIRGDRRKAGRREPTHRDIAYGDHQRHVFDLYIAESDSPTPLNQLSWGFASVPEWVPQAARAGRKSQAK